MIRRYRIGPSPPVRLSAALTFPPEGEALDARTARMSTSRAITELWSPGFGSLGRDERRGRVARWRFGRSGRSGIRTFDRDARDRVHESTTGSRSRRAVGVGDVAGERGTKGARHDRAAGIARHQGLRGPGVLLLEQWRHRLDGRLYADDAEVDTTRLSRTARYKGREEFERYFQEQWDAWTGLRMEPVDIAAVSGGRHLVEVRMTGTGGAVGSRSTSEWGCSTRCESRTERSLGFRCSRAGTLSSKPPNCRSRRCRRRTSRQFAGSTKG